MSQILQVKPISDILRQSKATQVFGSWFDDKGGMCALGVLMYSLYDEISGEAQDKIQDLIGIDTFSKIIALNDYERKSFSEIADYLESKDF